MVGVFVIVGVGVAVGGVPVTVRVRVGVRVRVAVGVKVGVSVSTGAPSVDIIVRLVYSEQFCTKVPVWSIIWVSRLVSMVFAQGCGGANCQVSWEVPAWEAQKASLPTLAIPPAGPFCNAPVAYAVV